jgi:hypothetical protein
MRPTPDVEWVFDGPEDAAAYLREVGILWAVWLVAMAALMVSTSWIVIVGGIGVLGLLLVLARPLQARAVKLVPDDDVPDPGATAFRKTKRDRVLRELAFGEAPLKAAGAGPIWIWSRRLIVLLTVVAFVVVLLDLLVPRA